MEIRKLNLILLSIIASLFLFGCDKEDKDREKTVELTIHPETKFSRDELSYIWSDALVISDSEDKEPRALFATITEGLDYNSDYERGYEYLYRVKKVWMHNPPQDVSSIKYIFLDLLSKKRVITENSERDIQLYVLPQKVEYRPRAFKGTVSSIEMQSAMLAKDMNSDEWMALTTIEGFDFEAGYEYVVNVKEVTIAEPYSKNYSLVDVVSKEVSEKEWPGVVYQ